MKKELIKKVREELSSLQDTNDIVDNIITSKEFIKKNSSIVDNEVMELLIDTDIKKKFGFDKSQLKALKKFYKAINVEVKPSALEELLSFEKAQVFSVGQDYISERMVYGLNLNDESYIITSKDEILKISEIEEIIKLKPKSNFVEISNLKASTVKFFHDNFNSDFKLRLSGLYSSIKSHYNTYMYFDDERTFDILATWTLSTYVYKCFRYCAYIHLNADKGSGKTRLLELLQDMCFNAQITTGSNPANIYRYIDISNATLLIDEAENFQDKQGELIIVLNSGFNCEGRVSRLVKNESGDYSPKLFSTYSPKALAGISDLPDVLLDRCIKIRIMKKPTEVLLKRYKKDDNFSKHIDKIVQGLYIFGLQYSTDIKKLYDSNIIELSNVLSDRDRDIWEPMLTIARFIDQSDKNDLGYSIENILKQYSEEKSRERSNLDMENNSSYKLLYDLNSMLLENRLIPIEKNELTLYNNEQLLRYLNEECEHNFSSVTHLTKQLNKFNISVERLTIDGQKQKYYVINRAIINDLMNRYNIAIVVDQ